MFDQQRTNEYRGGGILDGPSVWPSAGGRSDAALVGAVARRDRAALLEVFDAHALALYGVARRRCTPARAASAVEAVILGLWRRPDEFAGAGCTLRTFLVARVRVLSSASVGRSTAPPVVGSVALDESPLGRAVGPTMARRLRRLPDAEREVIELVYVGGHTCTSTGDLLGRPRELVADQISSGLAGLRAQRTGDDSWDDLLAPDPVGPAPHLRSLARWSPPDAGDPCP